MKTLDLKQAAALLKMHPQTVMDRSKAGDIPGAKPGKCWVFVEEDLIEWIRSKYHDRREGKDKRGKKQCSTSAQIVDFGGIGSLRQMEEQYANLLKLKTKKERKS